ncbi:MAG: 5-(carboxyamino)imidazole ribonucleotide synthase [Saprospirales bacterium]|nr:MAG: 5-(carboxyamino)imidazole ribonucleotide synthase [Saprospirales bacterium]
MNISPKKIGILGGGQLGKMLCMAAAPWHLELHILDKSRDFPAAPYCHHFTEGDFSSYEDVINFGKNLDLLTIEIENVNLSALKALKKMGKEIFPDPEFLEMVKDKGKQNNFFRDLQIPTPSFSSFESLAELESSLMRSELELPFVWKSRFEGYDGKGVRLVSKMEDLESLPDSPCLAEELVEIEKELAIIISRNAEGRIAVYDPVEMIFESRANLLDILIYPAKTEEGVSLDMRQTAMKIVSKTDYRGILAIEFFLDKKGRLLANEMAPRPHNSGHHTIECCPCSQYEQLLRAMLSLPPGDCSRIQQGLMFNLLGHPAHSGPAVIRGVDLLHETPNAHLHWYGKKETRPFRKMGHVVIAGRDRNELLEKAEFLKKTIKVTT